MRCLQTALREDPRDLADTTFSGKKNVFQLEVKNFERYKVQCSLELVNFEKS